MTNNKQQTAVEWYAGKVHDLQVAKDFGAISVTEYYEELTKAVQQAKEMEKEQAIKFALCYAFGQYNVSKDLKTHIEKFYEQTYGGNK
jgi:uncharacterized metal-binding protein